MIVLSVIIVFVISILLNFLFVKKLENKTNRICMRVLNVLLSFVFIILFISVEIINRHLNSFIDLGIIQLEKKVDEIYPGALQKQMNTEEIKNLLEKSLEKNEVNGVQALADNIIKTKIENYALVTLKTINVLERDNNKLSVKDALLSIKELSVNSVSPYFKVVKIILFVLYLILALLSVLLTFYLSKDKDLKNDGIVFGEEADKTFIGMKTE